MWKRTVLGALAWIVALVTAVVIWLSPRFIIGLLRRRVAERLYVIDDAGRIAYKGGTGRMNFDPGELESWLAQRFG